MIERPLKPIFDPSVNLKMPERVQLRIGYVLKTLELGMMSLLTDVVASNKSK